jgi:voltage-gated sodium channel
LFSNIAPEYFGDPLTSFYSIFKIFTIEGWYEIPDIVTENITNSVEIWFVRLYFVIVLFIGGIFGLSIINSVFVEGVINNDKDDYKLNDIISRLDSIEKKIK